MNQKVRSGHDTVMDAVSRIGLCALAAVAAAGCAQLPKPRPPEADRLCGPEIRGATELLEPRAFVLLGEMHGTNEIPYVVGELACQAAASGQPVTVAVEMAISEQALLDEYLNSAGRPEDQQRLFNGAFWNRPYQDGRSSKAMAAMLERLRSLKAMGLKVRAIAFDAPALSGDAHEAATAAHLLQARSAYPEDTFLVLCGNVHARTTQGVDWDPQFVPMGMRLSQALPNLRALDAEYAPGQAWTCKLAQPISCGVESIAAPRRKTIAALAPPKPSNQHLLGTQPAPGAVYDPAPSFRGYRPFVRLSRETSPEGYHGIFYVGPITASPPAAAASFGPG